MRQLRDRGVIQDQTVMITIRAEESRTEDHSRYQYITTAKFGGYDKLQTQNYWKVFRTIYNEQNKPIWGLKCHKIGSLGRNYLGENESRNVHFDPAIPFIYLSMADFEKIARHFLQLEGDWINVGDKPIRSISGTGYEMYWDKPCKDVKEPGYYMKFWFYDTASAQDENKQFKIELGKERGAFKVDGSHFGHPQRCYLPFFRHHREDLIGMDHGFNDIYFGAHAMQQYTFVLDNNPFDRYGQGYAQIMLGRADYDSA